MAKKKITAAQLIINNPLVPYVPNTLKYTEGQGEYKLEAAVAGPGQSLTYFTEDGEQKMSKCMFELYPDQQNIDNARTWKINKSDNVIQIVDDGVQRSFTNATVTNDYEVELQADGKISLEWMSDPTK